MPQKITSKPILKPCDLARVQHLTLSYLEKMVRIYNSCENILLHVCQVISSQLKELQYCIAFNEGNYMALQVKEVQKIDCKIHSWSTKNLLSLPLSLKPKKKLSSQSYRFLMAKMNRFHKYFRGCYNYFY